MNRSSVWGRKSPTGVTVASARKPWSAAVTATRPLPPRAKGPILTVAVAAIDTRSMSGAAAACAFTRVTSSKIASVWGTFFGLALRHLREGVAHPVQLGRDRPLARQRRVGVSFLGDQRAAYLPSGQARVQPARAELRVGVALTIDDGPDVRKQLRQMILGLLARAQGSGKGNDVAVAPSPENCTGAFRHIQLKPFATPVRRDAVSQRRASGYGLVDGRWGGEAHGCPSNHCHLWSATRCDGYAILSAW